MQGQLLRFFDEGTRQFNDPGAGQWKVAAWSWSWSCVNLLSTLVIGESPDAGVKNRLKKAHEAKEVSSAPHINIRLCTASLAQGVF